MTAKELYQAGKLTEAIQALNTEVRNNPTDAKRRTFLFELLAFAGEWDRAEKQVKFLQDAGQQAQLGGLLYLSAIHGERTREDTFNKREFPLENAPAIGVTINGTKYEDVSDADPRIGPRLEMYAAGAYLWLPFKHIQAVEIQGPKRLRDLLWISALVHTGPSFKDKELGEVLLPALTVFASKHSDENVRLGRMTDWAEGAEGLALPHGQKMLLADGEEFPFLEVRTLEFESTEEEEQTAAAETA